MTTKEIYDWLENLLTSPNILHRGADVFPLVICTSEPHLSGQGIVPIKSLSIGGDWYKGKILVTPDKDLVPKESHRDMAKQPIPWGTFCPFASKETANIPCCPNCEKGIRKTWTYCPYCGQKLDWGK